MTRQRAIERGDGDRILDQGAGIGCAQFERGVVQRGADGPPNVARILDHPCLHQRRHIGIEFLPGAEQLRHARARQLVVGGEPIALEPRACATARTARRSRARGTTADKAACGTSRSIRASGSGSSTCTCSPHKQVALSDHLQVVHDVVVARFLGLPRLAPSACRMGAAGEDGEAVFGRHRGDGSAATRAARPVRPPWSRAARKSPRSAAAGTPSRCARWPRPWRPPRTPAASRARAIWSRRRPRNIPLRFRR